MTRARIKELDTARALSMLIILLHHVPNYTKYFDGTPVWDVVNYMARWALGSFVLCSGYLIGDRYLLDSGLGVRQFYGRRLLRIMPLFAVSLVTWHPAHSITISLAALTGVINFIDMPNVFTLWFVSMMVVFYAVSPLLCRKSLLSIGGVSVLLEALLWIGSNQWGWESRLWLYFPCYAIGVMVAKFRVTDQRRIALAGALMAALLWRFWPLPEGFASVLRPLFGSGAMVCLAWVIGKARSLDKTLRTLAYSSMAAYMFHRQVFIFFRGVLGFPVDGPLRGAEILVVCIPTVLMAGFVIQRTYDIGLGFLLKRMDSKRLA